MASEFRPLEYINAYLQMENGIHDEMSDAEHEEKQKRFLRDWGGMIPPVLYHYVPFSQKYHVASLVLSKLWFSYPMYFNDPNDSRILLNSRFNNANKNQNRDYFLDYYTKSLAQIIDIIDKINREIKTMYENPDYNTRLQFKKYLLEQHVKGYYDVRMILEKIVIALDHANEMEDWGIHYTRYKTAIIEAFLSGFDKEVGICSFSTKNDNLLMWTHYANQSRGICIGFTKEELMDKLGIIFPVHYDRPVFYEELLDFSKPVIDYFNCRNQYLKRFLFKTREWEYENEWRALLDTQEYCSSFSASSKGFLSPALRPSIIYIGNNAEPCDEDFIRTYCESQKIECFKMRIEDTSWNFGKPELIYSPAKN